MSRIISRIETDGTGGTTSAHASTHQKGSTDEVTLEISQLVDFPSTMTPSAHTHAKADLTDATATPTAGKIPIADGSGKLDGWVTPSSGGGTPSATVTAETSFGASSSAGTSDAYSRGDHTHGTPANPVTAHESSYAHANLPATGEKAALVGTSGTPGSGNKYVTNDDSRNTNARTPTSHAASHGTGQTDAVTIVKAQVSDFPAFGTTSGTICQGNDSRLSDARTPSAHAASHIRGASDEIDGDKLDIDWNPTNYTPTTVTEADNADHLSAHLKGIDTALGSVTASNSVTVTAGEALSQYDAVYLHTDNKCYKAANNSTRAIAEVYAIVTQSGGISSSGTGTALRSGDVTNASWSFASAGLTVYLSTAGTITATEPTTPGVYWVPCGETTGATSIYFAPSTGVLIGTASGAPIITGLMANRPTAGVSGRIYLPTDGYPMSYDNGGGWDTYLNGFRCTAPPAASTLTLVRSSLTNSGTAAIADFNGGLLFTQSGNNSTSARDVSCAITAIPGSGTYTFTVGVNFLISPLLYSQCGICLTDGNGSTPKITSLFITSRATTDGYTIGIVNDTNPTTWNSESNIGGGIVTATIFLRFVDDRTNLKFSISHDGSSFVWIATVARTSFLIPAYAGVSLGQSGASGQAYPITDTRSAMKIFHWSLA